MAYIYDEKTGEFKATGSTRNKVESERRTSSSSSSSGGSDNEGCFNRGCLGDGCGSKLFWYFVIGLAILYFLS